MTPNPDGEPVNLDHRFFWSSLNGTWVTGLKIGIGMALTPVLITLLNPEVYGVCALILSIVELSLMLDFGFAGTLTRELGASLSQAKRRRIREVLTIGLAFYVGLAMLIGFIGYWAAPWIQTLIHMPPTIAHGMEMIQLAAIIAALYLYNIYYRVILNAHGLNQWNSFADLLNCGIGNMIGAYMLLLGYGLFGFFASRLLTAVLMTLFLHWQASRLDAMIFKPTLRVSWDVIQEVILISFHAAFMQIGYILAYNLDALIVGINLNATSVALLTILIKPLSVIFLLVMQASHGMLPMFSYALGWNSRELARKYFLSFSVLNNGLGIALLIPLGCFFGEVLQIFSGGHFGWKDILPTGLLPLALATFWLSLLQAPATHFLFAEKGQAYLSISLLLMSIANLGLSLLLVKPLGLMGVLLGTLVPMFVQQQMLIIPKACQKLSIPYMEYFQRVHVRLLPLAVVTLALTLSVRFLLTEYGGLTLWSILPVCITIVTASGLFYLKMIAGESERKFLAERFSGVVQKFGRTSAATITSERSP